MRSFFVFFVICCFLSPKAFALVYLKAQLGVSVTTDGTVDGTDFDTEIAAPYPITLGLGIKTSPLTSLALEVNYETTDLEELPASFTASSDTKKQFSTMLNLYFHTPKILGFEAFAGVGAGYTELTIDKNDYKGDGFTWQLSAGADIPLSKVLALVIEGRFFQPLDINLKDNNELDVGEFDTSQAKLLVGVKLKL